MAKNKRFEEVYSEGTMSTMTIARDKETGVNYLIYHSGYGVAMTPLLDSEGKVVVTPSEQ